MKARISGRAAAFAIKSPTGWELGRRGVSDRVKVAELDVARALGGTPDVLEMDFKTIAEVERRLEAEWSKDRALRLTILLLDPTEPDDGLADVAVILEKLLNVPHVSEHIENQFAQRELPTEARMQRALSLASDLPHLTTMLTRIEAWQAAIGPVRESFAALDDKLFGGSDEKADYRERAITAGAFRCLVEATIGGSLTDVGVFDLHNALRHMKNARNIAQAWSSAFERVSIEPPPLPADMADEFEEDFPDFGGGPGGHQKLQNALEQQRAILERVADGDYDNARRFARDLAQSQLASGGRPYLAKSLTRLSQRAREMEAFELDLEWAFEAVEYQPEDARTHTQLADALIQADRFDEAIEQFNLAAESGEAGYAATGYARVLKLLGRHEEALEAFSAAADDFKGSDHEIYALVGITNVMNDNGQTEAALEYNQALVKRFPEEPVARLNLATLLMRRGRFKDAWNEFEQADELSSGNLSALNGLASISRRVGRLNEARSRYSEVVRRYPRDINAHIGLIDTLRSLGEIAEASMYARWTAKRFPGSPRAAAKHAETASESGRYPEARKILAEAISRFPRDARLVLVKAMSQRREGKYDRALATIDAAIERFPYNRRFQRARADMLRRLGKVAAAESLYRSLVEEDQADTRARNGLASLLILRGDWAVAERLVENDNPSTSEDWRAFLLRAVLSERRGDLENSHRRLAWAIQNCPFAVERRLFVCALAKQAAMMGRARRAPRIHTVPERDIGNIIDFQLAAMTRRPHARKAYGALSRHLPDRYGLLREEIARNYGLSNQRPQHTKSWIIRQLNDEFILAAA